MRAVLYALVLWIMFTVFSVYSFILRGLFMLCSSKYYNAMVMRSLGSEQTAIDDSFGCGFMGRRLSPSSPPSLGDGGDP